MLIAVVQEVEDKKTGKKRYVIEWRHLLPEKGYYIMGFRRRWTDSEIRILIKYQDNLKKAAKILGRSYGAVRVKWSEIRKKLGLKRKTRVKCVPFPEPDISLRMEVVEKLLPRTEKVAVLLLKDCEETLSDRKKLTVREKDWVTRTVKGLLAFLERCQTGKEHLEIYKEEKEHADQADED